MACLRYGRGRPLFPGELIPKRKQGDKLEAGTAMAQRPDRARRKAPVRREQSRYDQALGNAKNAGKVVRFTLAQEATYADTDCELDCQILQIDKFDIEVLPAGWPVTGDTLWIKKSSIMGTRIFR